jgi:RNA methyltransferase, TrmH family
VITSNQNTKIKLVRSLLGRAKERREVGAFIAEGVRLVEEAVTSNWRFKFALYDDSLNEHGLGLIKRLEDEKTEVEKVESRLLQSLSETETPQGILAVLEFTDLPIPNFPSFILIPDQIRDPGNLGTLLRTAAAAGVDVALIPPETTDAFAPKVVRAGMGAHFRLPIISLDWDEIPTHLKMRNVFIADATGDSIYWDADFKTPLALIVGSEAEGVSAQARKLASKTVSIPMPGKMESLNAGVAGAVLMFEVIRQRSHV